MDYSYEEIVERCEHYNKFTTGLAELLKQPFLKKPTETNSSKEEGYKRPLSSIDEAYKILYENNKKQKRSPEVEAKKLILEKGIRKIYDDTETLSKHEQQLKNLGEQTKNLKQKYSAIKSLHTEAATFKKTVVEYNETVKKQTTSTQEELSQKLSDFNKEGHRLLDHVNAISSQAKEVASQINRIGLDQSELQNFYSINTKLNRYVNEIDQDVNHGLAIVNGTVKDIELENAKKKLQSISKKSAKDNQEISKLLAEANSFDKKLEPKTITELKDIINNAQSISYNIDSKISNAIVDIAELGHMYNNVEIILHIIAEVKEIVTKNLENAQQAKFLTDTFIQHAQKVLSEKIEQQQAELTKSIESAEKWIADVSPKLLFVKQKNDELDTHIKTAIKLKIIQSKKDIYNDADQASHGKTIRDISDNLKNVEEELKKEDKNKEKLDNLSDITTLDSIISFLEEKINELKTQITKKEGEIKKLIEDAQTSINTAKPKLEEIEQKQNELDEQITKANTMGVNTSDIYPKEKRSEYKQTISETKENVKKLEQELGKDEKDEKDEDVLGINIENDKLDNIVSFLKEKIGKINQDIINATNDIDALRENAANSIQDIKTKQEEIIKQIEQVTTENQDLFSNDTTTISLFTDLNDFLTIATDTGNELRKDNISLSTAQQYAQTISKSVSEFENKIREINTHIQNKLAEKENREKKKKEIQEIIQTIKDKILEARNRIQEYKTYKETLKRYGQNVDSNYDKYFDTYSTNIETINTIISQRKEDDISDIVFQDNTDTNPEQFINNNISEVYIKNKQQISLESINTLKDRINKAQQDNEQNLNNAVNQIIKIEDLLTNARTRITSENEKTTNEKDKFNVEVEPLKSKFDSIQTNITKAKEARGKIELADSNNQDINQETAEQNIKVVSDQLSAAQTSFDEINEIINEKMYAIDTTNKVNDYSVVVTTETQNLNDNMIKLEKIHKNLQTKDAEGYPNVYVDDAIKMQQDAEQLIASITSSAATIKQTHDELIAIQSNKEHIITDDDLISLIAHKLGIFESKNKEGETAVTQATIMMNTIKEQVRIVKDKNKVILINKQLSQLKDMHKDQFSKKSDMPELDIKLSNINKIYNTLIEIFSEVAENKKTDPLKCTNSTNNKIIKMKCDTLDEYKAKLSTLTLQSKSEPIPTDNLLNLINNHIKLIDNIFPVRVMMNFRTNFDNETEKNFIGFPALKGGTPNTIERTKIARENFKKLVNINDSTKKPPFDFLQIPYKFPLSNQGFYGSFYKVVENGQGIDVERDMDNLISTAQSETKQKMNYIYSAYGYSGSGKSFTLLNNDKGEAVLDIVLRQLTEKIPSGLEIKMAVYDLYGEMINDTEYKIEKVTAFNINNPTIDSIIDNVSHEPVLEALESSIDISQFSDFDKNVKKHVMTISNGHSNLITKIYKLINEYRVKTDFAGSRDHVLEPHIRVTPNNPESSRSHIFIDLYIFKNNELQGKVTIMDMAGTENVESIRNDYYYTDDSMKILELKEGMPDVLKISFDENKHELRLKEENYYINFHALQNTGSITKTLINPIKKLIDNTFVIKSVINYQQLIDNKNWYELYKKQQYSTLLCLVVLNNLYEFSRSLNIYKEQAITYTKYLSMLYNTDLDIAKNISNVTNHNNNFYRSIVDSIKLFDDKQTKQKKLLPSVKKEIEKNVSTIVELYNNQIKTSLVLLKESISNVETITQKTLDFLKEKQNDLYKLKDITIQVSDSYSFNLDKIFDEENYLKMTSDTQIVLPGETSPKLLSEYLDSLKKKYHDPIEYQGNYINNTLQKGLTKYAEALSKDPSLSTVPKDSVLTGKLLANNIFSEGGAYDLDTKFILLVNARLDFDPEYEKLYSVKNSDEKTIQTLEYYVKPEYLSGDKKFEHVKNQSYFEALPSALLFAHCVNPFKNSGDLCKIDRYDKIATPKASV